MVDRGNGPTRMIGKVNLRIYAEDPKDRVVNVARFYRTVLGRFAEAIGRTDDSTTLDASAAKQAKHRVAPMIASWRSH